MAHCQHRKAITVRGGTLRPAENRMPFEAAWCPAPDCGAFREESATSDPEPWRYPGGKIDTAEFILTSPGGDE